MSTPNQTPSEQDKAVETIKSVAKTMLGIGYPSLARQLSAALSAITKSKAGEQAKPERWTLNDRYQICQGVHVLGFGVSKAELQAICDAHNATLI